MQIPGLPPAESQSQVMETPELHAPGLPTWFQCTSTFEAFEAKHSRQRVWGTCHTVWPEVTCRLLGTPTLQIDEFGPFIDQHAEGMQFR